jgi:hypothetical protein
MQRLRLGGEAPAAPQLLEAEQLRVGPDLRLGAAEPDQAVQRRRCAPSAGPGSLFAASAGASPVELASRVPRSRRRSWSSVAYSPAAIPSSPGSHQLAAVDQRHGGGPGAAALVGAAALPSTASPPRWSP